MDRPERPDPPPPFDLATASPSEPSPDVLEAIADAFPRVADETQRLRQAAQMRLYIDEHKRKRRA